MSVQKKEGKFQTRGQVRLSQSPEREQVWGPGLGCRGPCRICVCAAHWITTVLLVSDTAGLGWGLPGAAGGWDPPP